MSEFKPPRHEGAETIDPLDLQMAGHIMAGLLASGHYTNQTNPADAEAPAVRRWDWGNEWEEDQRFSRYPAYAVANAIALWEELKHTMRHRE